MNPTQIELLEAITGLEDDGEVRSLFHVATLALMDYAWSWRVLNSLETAAMVMVERNGQGVPMKICSTPNGRRALAESRGEPAESIFSLAE